jgi:hypothetical protein
LIAHKYFADSVVRRLLPFVPCCGAEVTSSHIIFLEPDPQHSAAQTYLITIYYSRSSTDSDVWHVQCMDRLRNLTKIRYSWNHKKNFYEDGFNFCPFNNFDTLCTQYSTVLFRQYLGPETELHKNDAAPPEADIPACIPPAVDIQDYILPVADIQDYILPVADILDCIPVVVERFPYLRIHPYVHLHENITHTANHLFT